MNQNRVVFLPIRHHSPTCALALRRCLEDIRPAQVLIEAPIDFEPLVPQLTDPATRPPVAIVSLDHADSTRRFAVYPFCRHSPEFVAMTWAAGHGARIRFIDLPARDKAMGGRSDREGRLVLIANDRLDYNSYVAELCRRRGVPDGGALWDALFESQGPDVDWAAYFDAVALYCGHIRQIADVDDLKTDGTLARETHMRRCLELAMAEPGPIVVVTGGFHTPVLRTAQDTAEIDDTRPAAPGAAAYLIRYGFSQLDQQRGYGAGLPHPAWYDQLWTVLETGGEPGELALQTITAFSDHLRRSAPGMALSSPVSMQAIAAAHRLASLRELPFPGRNEVIDGLCSAGVKEALVAGRTPLLDALSQFLTGSEVGDLPAGASQPPIIAVVRDRARALGFVLEGGERRTRDLDVWRKPRHAEASRFLHALALIGSPFARKLAGPDLYSGWRDGPLIETWSYVWSPMVEQHLLSVAFDGLTLEALCRKVMHDRIADLAGQGRSRSTRAMTQLLVQAARTGFARLITEMLDRCQAVLVEDPDPASVIGALSLTQGLAMNAPPELADAFREFRRQAFARLIQLFPDFHNVPADRMDDLTTGLAEIAAMALEDDEALDLDLLAEAAIHQPADLPPVLVGALAAFCGLVGVLDEAGVADRVAAAMDGSYEAVGARAQALTGCLTVNPRLLVNSEALRLAADGFLASLDTEAFLSVLPELRLALTQLSPSEVDQVAAWVSGFHRSGSISPHDRSIPLDEVTANLGLADQLTGLWVADGLGGWLGGRP